MALVEFSRIKTLKRVKDKKEYILSNNKSQTIIFICKTSNWNIYGKVFNIWT